MSDLSEKIKNGALVLDVRTRDEFEEEHYEGALLIPVNELPARIAELGDKSRPIVVYCASGARSASAARFLKQSGFADVTNAGGLSDMPS
jgi:phage shock protein E